MPIIDFSKGFVTNLWHTRRSLTRFDTRLEFRPCNRRASRHTSCFSSKSNQPINSAMLLFAARIDLHSPAVFF